MAAKWCIARLPVIGIHMIFFSLRFSLQFWYRWKEGNNSGIIPKFEVDPNKRSRVRAELEQREVGRLSENRAVLQRSTAWHNRGSDGRRVHLELHDIVCICCMQDHRSPAMRFSLQLPFLFFFFYILVMIAPS